jgi:hypothetical protein
MNRKIYAVILTALVCLAFGLLTSCSSSSTPPPPPTITITAASGSGQTATVSTAFANPLVANVKTGGTPTSGVSVAFAAPSTGASCALSATTATTDANGNASVTCTANATTGAYNVTATTTGATTGATFALTNTAVPTANYVFYLSGLEAPNAGNGTTLSYYSLAGTVTINQLEQVVGGIEDYNDGNGITQTGIAITGGALSVDNTGQGTLTLTTTNTSIPVATQVLGIQAVNIFHLLIVQFDGSATSSGSMDMQTTTSLPSAMGYAFTLSGVDNNDAPVGYGGVFSLDGTGAITGIDDLNDTGVQTIGATFSGTFTAPDATFGRGQITGVTLGSGATAAALTLNYYVVGPEVIRIIDLDVGGVSGGGGAAVGSAFGQGTTTTFDNTSLPTSVFALQGDPLGPSYAAVGVLAPAAGAFTGVADYDFFGSIVNAANLAGTYSVSNTVGGTTYNGYGNVTITSANLGNVQLLGLYMTDPTLNLIDPNNLSGRPGGGALLLDLDVTPGSVNPLSGGIGIVIPQTDTTAANFNGTYAFGGQDYNDGGVGGSGTFNEFDFVGLGTVAASTGAFAGTGLVSDPFAFFAATGAEIPAVPFAGTITPDTTNPGRYTMIPMTVTPSGDAGANLSVIIYQANGSQLLWMEDDTFALFGGSLQTQGTLAPPKAQAKHKH